MVSIRIQSYPAVHYKSKTFRRLHNSWTGLLLLILLKYVGIGRHIFQRWLAMCALLAPIRDPPPPCLLPELDHQAMCRSLLPRPAYLLPGLTDPVVPRR